jgi:hypothetical protein
MSGITPRMSQSAISAWLSDGTGGFRVVMDLRLFPKLPPPGLRCGVNNDVVERVFLASTAQ